MTLFAPSVIDDDGVVSLSTSLTPAVFIHGQAYDIAGTSAYGSTTAPAATDRYVGGFLYSATGALHLVDATAGLPLGVRYNQGFAMSADSEVCYTSDAVDPLDVAWIAGVAVTLDGRLYASVT